MVLNQLENQSYISQIRQEVTQNLSEVRGMLETRLYSNIHSAEGVRAVVALNPELDQEDFSRSMEPWFRDRKDLRNVALAPDLVIRFMYPIEGNEPAIGVDFRTIPEQYGTAELARTTGKTVVAGPLNLVQGGVGIIARVPIFITGDLNARYDFWGLASVVMDIDLIYRESGLLAPPGNIQIAIRGKDGLGEDGEHFFGSQEIYSLDPIQATVRLPFGNWQMAAIPSGGWPVRQPGVSGLLLGYTLSAVIILLLTFLLVVLVERIRSAKAMAQNASQAKSNFLAAVSHEIRTPLNAILGFSDLLNQGKLEREEKKYLESLQQSSQNLLLLVNDILDFSQIESGSIELSLERISPRDLMESLYQTFYPQALNRGLDLTLDFTGTIPPVVFADELRIQQIVGNLVSNALKFTPKGSVNIHLEARDTPKCDSDEKMLIFSVSDTGIGIGQSDIAKIFLPFFQLEQGNTRRFEGVGLGLSICNHLLETMDSVLEVESTINKGSVFSFSIILKLGSEIPVSGKPESSIPDSIQSESIRITLVEDNPINSLVLKKIIEKLLPKAVFSIAQNGQEAVEGFLDFRPQIIFMDVQMPIMDGIEATRKIRSIEKDKGYESIPIIALSAGVQEAEKNLCLEAGMDEFVRKPIDLSTMVKLFKIYLV